MKKYFFIAIAILLPTLAFAQVAGNDIMSLWGYIFRLIGQLTRIFWVLAVMTFLFGLVQFLQNADSADAQKRAKSLMTGSIIAFTIAVSFWGLVTFVIDAASLTPDEIGTTVQTVTSSD